MTAIEIHRLAMDTQDHIERVADMWFSYLKFAMPILISYCLGWMIGDYGFPFNTNQRPRA